MKVQRMVNLGRRILVLFVAIMVVFSGTACKQASMELPFVSMTQDIATQIEMGDRLALVVESVQTKVEEALEVMGNGMEAVSEQVKSLVDSAKATFNDLNQEAADVLDEAVEDAEQALQETTDGLKQSLKTQQDSIAKGLKATTHLVADALDIDFN